jgi:tRNA-Thr(GGU) m(6)t(6)A37 methyltransferase TsaA
MVDNEKRPGEISLAFNPSDRAADAGLVFIGRIRSPWNTRSECPRNLVQARERGLHATIEVDEEWRPGLTGLQNFTNAVILYWMHQARRDLILQRPKHKSHPTGVFALRSPVRPNPIALATVRILDVDQAEGRIEIDAIDCLDNTPLVDIKPRFDSIDNVAANFDNSG